jgi:quercetin dioxygenase-like cupin family protein
VRERDRRTRRTPAWHTHPLGQTLIVTAGGGWTKCESEAKVEIRAVDVI